MNERLLALLLQQALLLSVAVALMAALRPLLLKRLGAGSAYAAWLLVPALLLTPLLPRPAQEPLRVVLQATGNTQTLAAPALPAPPPDHAAVWLGLWLGGAALVLLEQARRQWRLARLGERLPAGSSPALVGLLKPRVALPVDFDQRFSPAERELILAHEQVHRARLDNLWNLLACALTALHWWNPLAWWAARRMQADQELACDAAVLAARPGALADYTRALLAAHDLHHLGAPLASRWGSSHPLVERIAMLKNPKSLTRRSAAAVALAMAGAASLAYAAQTAPVRGNPFIHLKGALIYQDGDFVRRSTLDFVGRSGEPTHAVIGATQATVPDVSINLVPTVLDDGRLQLEMSFEGLPTEIKANRPRMIVNWGAPATLESIDAKTVRRLTVFIVATRSEDGRTTAPQPGTR